jgi:AsmA protein
LLSAFNPFAKEDAVTELQCGVAQVLFEDGLATLDPMALQSDKMTMLGKGKIDLGTEKLDLQWVTKPRKGIGLSASLITNPYIKLGGTLSNPSVQLKGVEAVASTGVAVATLGISLVAKGMLDRITAEKKVCQQALEQIGRSSGATSKKSKKKRQRK